MILAVNRISAQKMPMEMYVISFLIFVLVSAALAIGLLLGRGPIHGRCHSDDEGGCAETGSCADRCEKRRSATTDGET